ncbi:hypothetical protein K503DRAFT_600078 [Rhizopogon vinicolor AM-OR11-026]|uniref:Uncharacterized protein n=1 Tax=Rhizopogon vinicolor AM-OR11-026 TaxID=1314800 RepID=A0A1B7MIY2_9AGAM|nr:hypothetical protein K503DRAFT_600078 [Rhizopogon vinicolor AM-OR11-026]
MMANLVDKMDVGPIAKPNRTLVVGLLMLAVITGTVSALSRPVAPIVVPIVASAVLAKWVYDVYQLSYVLAAYRKTRITERAQSRGAAALYSLHRGFNAHPTSALSIV